MAKTYSIVAEPWSEKMIADLQDTYGYKKMECFKAGLRLLHRKEFPNYAKSNKDEGIIDPKKYCENLGGVYKLIDGRPACLIAEGSGTRTKYLD